jgi:hypothetical protein
MAMLLGVGLVCSGARGEDYYDQQLRLKALDKRCEQARQETLKPVREKLVKDCVGTERRALQDCELQFAEYGESTSGRNGNIIKGLYYDLAQCQEAKRAWDAWEAAQPLRK